MKNDNPAVLFYTSDFLTGVIDLDMEERGQYITLLCYQHQKGRIKGKILGLLVGSVSDNVLEKFKEDENGYYYNQRMELETIKRIKFVEKQRENGRKGGRPKKTHGFDLEKPKRKPLENEDEDDNENINDNNIYSFIEINLGRTINPIEFEKIREWEDTDLTRYAISESILSGGRSVRYFETVIESYKAKGFKTVEDVKAYDKKRKEEKRVNKKETSAEHTERRIRELEEEEIGKERSSSTF